MPTAKLARPLSWLAVTAHLISLYVAVGLLAAMRAAILSPWWWPYLFLVFLVTTTIFAIALLAHHRTLIGAIVIALVGQATAIILFFAISFQATGLIVTGQTTLTHSFADAAYFSLVTWTTLGYGDILPPPSYRLLAAMEAVIGYIYLGLTIGLLTNLFRSTEA